MKKVVLKLESPDDKAKIKVMKTVSGIAGVDSISMDSKNMKLTVTGDVDPVHIVNRLRRLCHTEIISVGPAKEPDKKKEESKKEEPKKQEVNKEPKNEQSKQGEDKKDQQKDKKEYPLAQAYQVYHPPMPAYYHSTDEDPNACVIS